MRNNQLDFLDEEGMDVLCNILMQSQEFMRQLAVIDTCKVRERGHSDANVC